uniref:Uncharacterized protein n=1 Tax=Junco hyemalis TaxID=40217 RepID=A0A8C5JKM1_JUNHY
QRGRKKERKEVLTMSQMGKGTLRRRWELSEVTEGTPAHQRMENSQGSFTVYRFTLRLGDMQDPTKPLSCHQLIPGTQCKTWTSPSSQQEQGAPKGCSRAGVLAAMLHPRPGFGEN